MTQAIVIVEVFPSRCDAKYTPANEFELRMNNARWITWIRQRLGDPLTQAQPPINLVEDRQAAITAQGAAVKIDHHLTPTLTPHADRLCVTL
jgi:hypothetical protein